MANEKEVALKVIADKLSSIGLNPSLIKISKLDQTPQIYQEILSHLENNQQVKVSHYYFNNEKQIVNLEAKRKSNLEKITNYCQVEDKFRSTRQVPLSEIYLKFESEKQPPPTLIQLNKGIKNKEQLDKLKIDRLLNSSLAVKQIIGRVLRQPKPAITHQLPELLNTAHFYIQVEKQSTFQGVIEEINHELEKNDRGIDIKPTTSAEKPEIVKVKGAYQLPKIICNAAYAEPEITKIVHQMPDWRKDKINTRGDSYRIITKKHIDKKSNFQEIIHEKTGDTDEITARAIFYREIIRKLPQIRGVILLDESKFDALIGFKSNVYGQIVETVDKVIKSYLDNCQLEASETELYTISDHLLYNPANSINFNDSIHPKYSQLNRLEEKFARELDKFGYKWCRNPSRTGYSIPLVTLGSTRNFYPDFLIFHPKKIIAVDTSGEHLIKDKVDRKLLNISPKLLVCFVSEGKWDDKSVEKIDENGWTLWKRRISDGNLSVIHQENLKAIIELMLENIN